MLTVASIEEAKSAYYRTLQEQGFHECQIPTIGDAAIEITDEGFEIRSNYEVTAFITFNGEFIDGHDYLADHPDREDL